VPFRFYFLILVLLPYISKQALHVDIFKFVPALAVGFLAYGAVAAFPVSIKNQITWWIMVVCTVATYLLFKSPWIFPALIVASGIATNFSQKRIPQKEQKPRKINWWNAWLFVALFLAAGVTSEVARKHDWEHRKAINLFENLYRMGSLVFGGGHVLMPMMYEQYSVRPNVVRNRNPKVIHIDKEDMTTGMGIVRAMPGPVFSIAAFTGGMALKNDGPTMQVAGVVIGAIGIFLPSLLFVLFFFPIWSNLKRYAVFYRSLEGINAAVVGIMIAATLFITKDISLFGVESNGLINLLIIICTFLLLRFTQIASPFFVLACLILGYFF
jgi:chromate transporter